MSEYSKLALLVSVLLIGIANLSLSLGWIGNSDSQYRVVNSPQMDMFGFKKLAEKNGVAIHRDGGQPVSVPEGRVRVSFKEDDAEIVIDFPEEIARELAKHKILPSTIQEIEKEGWKFVTVTSDNHYIFRKRK